MVRFIDKGTKVLVQGITGKQGSFHTKIMLDYGTEIVAGVTPGKGGGEVWGIPVYDTVFEAKEEHQADSSIVFVPALFALDAGLEALESKLDPVVMITEGIPIRDSIELIAQARKDEITLVGPNTPGIIKPDVCKIGIMPSNVFSSGSIGIVSRSGTLFYEVASQLRRAGLGESTCVGLGGDPVVGLNFVEVLKWFEEDDETEAVALIGEIGGDEEEKAAEFISEGGLTKPVSAYIAGRTAVPGKRMGHAGAIIQGSTGTAQSKIEALKGVGVTVGNFPVDVAKSLSRLLK